MAKKDNRFRSVLRIVSSVALLFYFFFLIGEEVPIVRADGFKDISVYLLFILFVFGFVYSWRKELRAGIIFTLWYAIQWVLVLYVWEDAAMTLIFGLPIGLLGIGFLIYAIRRRIKK